MKLETETNDPRRLVLEFTTHHKVMAVVRPGGGGVAGAIEDTQRYLRGCINVDPASVRYYIESEAETNGCSPDRRH